MVYGWRGTIGLVKPTFRPGSLEKFIRLMPDGVCVVPRFVGIRAGTATEFDEAVAVAETRVAELAELGVDLVIIQGAPPIMLRGVQFDESLTQRLRAEYGVEVLTATRAQMESFDALGVRSLAGLTYFQGALNEKFANFFKEAGYQVTAMQGLQGVAFSDAGKVPSEEIYIQAKKVFVEFGGECLYLLGAGWDCLPVIESLEHDLGVPVVTNINADVWAAQKRLRLREPVSGYGRLLREMP
jgi:maleate isomerase